MSYHEELREMRASVERRHNAQHVPDTYGFDSDRLPLIEAALRSVLEDRGAVLLVKLGLKSDGSPEAWLIVKDGAGEIVYVGDYSWTCPPRPPEDCEA